MVRPFFRVNIEDAFSVRRPERQVAAARARRGVIAENAAAEIEVEVSVRFVGLASGVRSIVQRSGCV